MLVKWINITWNYWACYRCLRIDFIDLHIWILLECLIVLLTLKMWIYLLHVLFSLDVMRLVRRNFRLILLVGMKPRVKELESTRIIFNNTSIGICVYLIIRVSKLSLSMGISTIFAEMAYLVFSKLLAEFGLVVVVWNL